MTVHAKARYLFIVSMDVDADKVAVFNDVYDNEHIPLLLEVPGVLAASRCETVPLEMILGGERKTMVAEGEPRFTAIYELESPDVLVSQAWSTAVDKGRWTTEVRPYTRNRRHVLKKVM